MDSHIGFFHPVLLLYLCTCVLQPNAASLDGLPGGLGVYAWSYVGRVMNALARVRRDNLWFIKHFMVRRDVCNFYAVLFAR